MSKWAGQLVFNRSPRLKCSCTYSCHGQIWSNTLMVKQKKNRTPAMARTLQTAIIQSTMLYGEELTWDGKKTHSQQYQLAINRMARSTLGSPVNPPGGLDQRECPDAGRVLAKLQTSTLRAESPVSPGRERHRGYLTAERDGTDRADYDCGNLKPLAQRTELPLVPRNPWELSDSGSMASDTESNLGTINAAIPSTTPSANPSRPILATKSRSRATGVRRGARGLSTTDADADSGQTTSGLKRKGKAIQ